MFLKNKGTIEEAKRTLVKCAAEYLANKQPEEISEKWNCIIKNVTNLIREFDPEWNIYMAIFLGKFHGSIFQNVLLCLIVVNFTQKSIYIFRIKSTLYNINMFFL